MTDQLIEQTEEHLAAIASLFEGVLTSANSRAEKAEFMAGLSESTAKAQAQKIEELEAKLSDTTKELARVKGLFKTELDKVAAAGMEAEKEATKQKGIIQQWSAIFNGETPKRAKDRLKRLQDSNAKLTKDKETQRREIVELYANDQNMRKKLVQAGSLSIYRDNEKQIHVFIHHTTLTLQGSSGKETKEAICLQYWQGTSARMIYLDPHDNQLNVEVTPIDSIDPDAEIFMRGWLQENFVEQFKKRNKGGKQHAKGKAKR